MLECCSIVVCCILSAIMLLIADSCHSCFACHLQTVHPFPVIFISISTEIIFPVAYLYCQVTALFILFLPEHAYTSHITSRISCMYCIMLLVYFSWLIVVPLVCVLVLGRAGRRVRERGTCWVRLRGSSFRQLWEPCRQDDHPSKSLLSLLC